MSKVKIILFGTGENGKSTLVNQLMLMSEEKDEIYEIESRVRDFSKRLPYGLILMLNGLVEVITKNNNNLKYFDNYLQSENKIKEILQFYQSELERIKIHNEPIIKKEEILQKLENTKILSPISTIGNLFIKSKLFIEDEILNNIELCNSLFELFKDLNFVKFILENDLFIHYFLTRYEFKFCSVIQLLKNNIDVTNIDKSCFKYFTFKTVGIAEKEIKLKNQEICLVDLGGQRSERRKWERVLTDNSLQKYLFIISLGDFNRTCYEDDDLNRLIDSLECFETTLQKFKQIKNIDLLFTKIEEFDKKCLLKENVNYLKDLFLRMNNCNEINEMKEFIVNQFKEKDVNKQIKNIYYLNSCFNDKEVKEFVNKYFCV
ncbi:hypothetical protein ABK040_011476 [Willaertia magna]